MSQEIKNILLIGASGNLGPPLLHTLSPNFKLSVLTRASSKATFDSSITVYTISDDYPISGLLSIFKGQDAVISLLRSQHLALIKRCIDVCVTAGVKRFIPGEFGSNSASATARAAVPIFDKKWEVRNYLEGKKKDGLSWTGVICGAFFDWGLTASFLGFDLSTKTATIYDKGTVPCQLTVLSDIAQAVKGILLDPAATANQYIYISTFHLNQKQILEALEKATSKKWEKKYIGTAEARVMGFEKAEKGDFAGLEDVLTAAHWSEVEGMDYEGEESWNERLGLQKRDLNDIVTKVVRGEEI